MTEDQIIKAIGLVGFGGLLKSAFDFLIATKKSKQDSQHSFKETRYKAIILLCYALIYYERENSKLVINRPDIDSKGNLLNELQVEFFNMSLYASDKVIISMKEFIKHQNKATLINLAITMRRDLYGIRTFLKNNHFDVEL